MSVIREGYAGKAKGRKQVLWERGWFLEGMSTTATVATEMNIDTVLGNLPDFKNGFAVSRYYVLQRSSPPPSEYARKDGPEKLRCPAGIL